jgi:hypothetical protein
MASRLNEFEMDKLLEILTIPESLNTLNKQVQEKER